MPGTPTYPKTPTDPECVALCNAHCPHLEDILEALVVVEATCKKHMDMWLESTRATDEEAVTEAQKWGQVRFSIQAVMETMGYVKKPLAVRSPHPK